MFLALWIVCLTLGTLLFLFGNRFQQPFASFSVIAAVALILVAVVFFVLWIYSGITEHTWLGMAVA